MSNEATGTIILINDTKHISDKFKKREFVLEIKDKNPEYSELVQFETIQDKCELLDRFNVGQEITVGYNLKGRLWNSPTKGDMYFNTLQVWRIDVNKQEGVFIPASNEQPIDDSLVPF